MKAIILAAGYATRLYPLTKDKAKPLLEVGGRPILNHIMEKLEEVVEVDEVFIVTNEKFALSFSEWVEGYQGDKKVTVINDHTTTNANRLGAIADIQYVIDKVQIEDDLIVLAGDNLFDFSLKDFVAFFKKVKSDCITVHELNDPAELQHMGVVEVDRNHQVISFEEKPEVPKTHLAGPPFYIYQQETLPLIKQYLTEGNNPDAPGHLIPWLIKHKSVFAYRFEGLRHDIGTIESYLKVQELY